MIAKLIDWYMARVVRRMYRDLETIHPDTEDRATALFAMGANLLETQRFGEGVVVDRLVVDMTKDEEEEGWYVEAQVYKLDNS